MFSRLTMLQKGCLLLAVPMLVQVALLICIFNVQNAQIEAQRYGVLRLAFAE